MEYDGSLCLTTGESMMATLVFHNCRHDAQPLNIRSYLPEGITASKSVVWVYIPGSAEIEMKKRPEVEDIPILILMQ